MAGDVHFIHFLSYPHHEYRENRLLDIATPEGQLSVLSVPLYSVSRYIWLQDYCCHVFDRHVYSISHERLDQSAGHYGL